MDTPIRFDFMFCIDENDSRLGIAEKTLARFPRPSP